jgi:hypothetical protein
MCDEDADFTTITGPREQVEWLMDVWEKELTFSTGEHLWERGIRLRWDDLGDGDPALGRSHCPAVAQADHPGLPGAQVAAQLTALVLTASKGRGAGLLCEAGHMFTGDSVGPAGVPAARPTPLLDPAQVARALAHRPGLPRLPGSRVALLDTGVAAAPDPMTDFTGTRPVWNLPPTDPHGHGTAVAEAVRAACPHAAVSPIRVLDATSRGTSLAIYQGLVTALWDAQGFTVVNASFGVDARTTCGTALGATFHYLMDLRHVTPSAAAVPVLVVAAGNNRSHLRSPADVVGARVVTATDLAGAPAAYCASLTLPSGTLSTAAPGGVRGDPLGHYPNFTEIYGTSFAAGFVSGWLLT